MADCVAGALRSHVRFAWQRVPQEKIILHRWNYVANCARHMLRLPSLHEPGIFIDEKRVLFRHMLPR